MLSLKPWNLEFGRSRRRNPRKCVLQLQPDYFLFKKTNHCFLELSLSLQSTYTALMRQSQKCFWFFKINSFFLSLGSDKPLMLLIHKTWCGACKGKVVDITIEQFDPNKTWNDYNHSLLWVFALGYGTPPPQFYFPTTYLPLKGEKHWFWLIFHRGGWVVQGLQSWDLKRFTNLSLLTWIMRKDTFCAIMWAVFCFIHSQP